MSDAIADPTDCFQLVFDKLGIISDELDRNDSKTVLLTTRELLELTLSLHKDAVKRLGSLQKDREIHEREKEADMRILQKKHDELDTLITAARHIKVNETNQKEALVLAMSRLEEQAKATESAIFKSTQRTKEFEKRWSEALVLSMSRVEEQVNATESAMFKSTEHTKGLEKKWSEALVSGMSRLEERATVTESAMAESTQRTEDFEKKWSEALVSSMSRLEEQVNVTESAMFKSSERTKHAEKEIGKALLLSLSRLTEYTENTKKAIKEGVDTMKIFDTDIQVKIEKRVDDHLETVEASRNIIKEKVEELCSITCRATEREILRDQTFDQSLLSVTTLVKDTRDIHEKFQREFQQTAETSIRNVEQAETLVQEFKITASSFCASTSEETRNIHLDLLKNIITAECGVVSGVVRGCKEATSSSIHELEKKLATMNVSANKELEMRNTKLSQERNTFEVEAHNLRGEKARLTERLKQADLNTFKSTVQEVIDRTIQSQLVTPPTSTRKRTDDGTHTPSRPGKRARVDTEWQCFIRDVIDVVSLIDIGGADILEAFSSVIAAILEGDVKNIKTFYNEEREPRCIQAVANGIETNECLEDRDDGCCKLSIIGGKVLLST